MPANSPPRAGFFTSGIVRVERHRVIAKTGQALALRTRGRAWMRIRADVLSRHPLCVHCDILGITRPATEVDHIKRVVDGGTDDLWNLQPLCHDCHARKTLAESGLKPRPAFGIDGYPKS